MQNVRWGNDFFRTTNEGKYPPFLSAKIGNKVFGTAQKNDNLLFFSGFFNFVQ